MMNDWTDVIGEELRNIEVPLPADDFEVLLVRKAAAGRRRRIAAWSWAGAVASVAAVVAVAVLLFREDTVVPGGGPVPPVIAENVAGQVDTLEVIEDVEQRLVAHDADVDAPDVSHVPESFTGSSDEADMDAGDDNDGKSENSDGEIPFDIVKDENGPETLLADNADAVSDNVETEAGGLRFEDLPEEKQRRRVRVSLAATGAGTFGGTSMMLKAMEPAGDFAPPPADPPLGNPDYSDPGDSLNVTPSSKSPLMAKSSLMARDRYVRDTDYDHFQPVSFGISARFTLTKRFSLNTGLNYTLYTSRVTRKWSDGEVENLKQNVHYLGIPVRCDWLLVDRRHFSLYLGAGAQIDKAVYAKCGDERLYDRTFLFSINAALGLQYNITDRLGLYLEPELVGNLNKPYIETFRSDNDLMLSARAGLRIIL